MAEGGFLERKTVSPTSLAIVILLHGAAITALAMSKMEVIDLTPRTRTEIYDVYTPPEPEPEPIPEPKAEPQPAPRTQVDYVPPIVPPLPRPSNDLVIRPTPDIPVFDPRPGTADVAKPADPPRPVPPPEPVRREAEMLRSSELQPPYPASEERAGEEGRVSARVFIGTDGRVKRVEKVSATSDAFYRATERHALRAWRFRPASVDGRPVESSKVITVRFTLND